MASCFAPLYSCITLPFVFLPLHKFNLSRKIIWFLCSPLFLPSSMHFKALFFALVAIAARVSAQTIENNACSQCAFAAIPNEPTCAALTPVDMQQLQAVFANNSVNGSALVAAAQNNAIKTCLCHWSTDTFGPKGAAASCTATQGSAPVACDATQVAEATAKIAPFSVMLQCNSNNSTTPNPTTSAGTPTSTGSSPNTANAASLLQLNMPYIVSMAALGLATVASF
ncbi:hypothetical protein BC939DRAFT_442163 [Gamsiella multidivaricata]|uniref:uncharacterized protein n=1 Tax=Gamsiella multidivaricata TaxID=101098 RepID=UPI00221E60AB|nr:uncharacterized protein BC939DRAFT_442163 [Gamsiella multidivaricata]KAI7828887.1 hypothetical protein BC939DRAFT_442163 [Gamsiella multidivaricata]